MITLLKPFTLESRFKQLWIQALQFSCKQTAQTQPNLLVLGCSPYPVKGPGLSSSHKLAVCEHKRFL